MDAGINFKLGLLAALTVSLSAVGTTNAQAQGVQNWINNEVKKVQQDYSNGAINPAQAASLNNRAAQIQNQEAVDMSQNGGTLTPQQSQKIGSEVRRMNQGVNNAVYNNSPYAPANAGVYQAAPPYNAGAYPRPYAGQWRNNQAGYQNNPNFVPAASGQMQNPYYGQHQHHHHYQEQNQ